MWFPEEVWRHIQSFATYRKYYLLYPPRNDLHANLYRVLDVAMKVRLHAFLNDESREIVVCLDEMVQYMLDNFDKLILVTLRDWEAWRNFTLLMIIRTATYQTEAESDGSSALRPESEQRPASRPVRRTDTIHMHNHVHNKFTCNIFLRQVQKGH